MSGKPRLVISWWFAIKIFKMMLLADDTWTSIMLALVIPFAQMAPCGSLDDVPWHSMDTVVQLSGRRLSSDHPHSDNGTAVEPGEPFVSFLRVLVITPSLRPFLHLGQETSVPKQSIVTSQHAMHRSCFCTRIGKSNVPINALMRYQSCIRSFPPLVLHTTRQLPFGKLKKAGRWATLWRGVEDHEPTACQGAEGKCRDDPSNHPRQRDSCILHVLLLAEIGTVYWHFLWGSLFFWTMRCQILIRGLKSCL